MMNETIDTLNPMSQRILAIKPEPFQQRDGKKIASCQVCYSDGTKCRHYIEANTMFLRYASSLAECKGVTYGENPYEESEHGYRLADGHAFAKIEMQILSPSMGYIDLFAVTGLCVMPPQYAIICLGQTSYLSVTLSVAALLNKIYKAQAFYDPEGKQHSILLGPKVFMQAEANRYAMKAALDEDVPLNFLDPRIASAIGVYNDYLLAQPPADLRKKIMNTNRRTKPGLQRLEEIENTRKEGEQNQNAMEGDVQTVPLTEAFFQGKPASYWLGLEEKNRRLTCQCKGLLQTMQAGLDFADNASESRFGGF